MRTVALLGGMTPQVTALYYNLMNEAIRSRLGQRHSPQLYIYSTNLEHQLQRIASQDWDAFAAEYIDAVSPLTSTSPPRVHGVALCAVLAHKVSARLAAALPEGVQFLDAAGFVARKLQELGISQAGLLGPGVTMTDHDPEFFIGKLTAKHGITVLVPETEVDLEEVNRGMLEEVVKGKDAVTASTAQMFRDQAKRLVERGAQALILGSTDLGFVLGEDDVKAMGLEVEVLDIAKVHAEGIAAWILEDEV